MEILRGLNETNPGYPVVADLLSESRTLADANPKVEPAVEDTLAEVAEIPLEKKGGKLLKYGGFSAAGVVFIGLIIAVIVLATRKKKPTSVAQTFLEPVAVVPKEAAQINTTPCPSCQAPIPKNSKFCNECGAKNNDFV